MGNDSGDNSMIGFKDYVKNPELFDAMVEANAQKQLRTFSGVELERLVERLLDRNDREAVELLTQAGERAVPALVAAIADKRYQKVEESTKYLPSTPLERVLDLVEDYRPVEAVPLIAPLAHHKHEYLRAKAGFVLAKIGNDDCVSPAKILVADADQHVRAMTLIGLAHSIEANQASATFRREMFEVIASIVSDPNKYSFEVFNYAPGLLLDMDRARATDVLTADEMLVAERPGIHEILKALNTHQISISGNRLISLLEAWLPNVDKYPQSYAYGEALIALSRIDGAKAEPIVRQAIEWKRDAVSERAAEALCLIRGISEPWDTVHERLEKVGFDGLSQPERHYIDVGWLKGEVDNGGFSQYFFNSSGDRSREALIGLKAMNATKTAAILQKALATFGEKGPSPDRSERQRQLSRLFDEQDAMLGQLNDEFYKDEDDLDVTMLLYVAIHADDFKAQGSDK